MRHAKLSPSRVSLRMACPGSNGLEALFPNTSESIYAREGNAAHWVAQQYLLNNYKLPDIAPNGEPITNEMLEGAEFYENVVRMPGIFLHIEETIDISSIHPDCFGTPDCWFVQEEHLYIFDYKFGHGYIDAFQNWQMLEYAAGIFQIHPDISLITLTIVQPRSYTKDGSIRSWTINTEQLRTYILELQVCEEKASSPDAVCIPNPGCKFCSARHVCSALQDADNRLIDIAKQSHSYELNSIQTGKELQFLKFAASLIDARITGLEEQAKAMIMRGESVTGFKLEPTIGRLAWNKSIDEIIMLGELIGINLSKSPDVITPTQALKAGLDETIIKEYSEKLIGKLKLVEEINASKIFKK